MSFGFTARDEQPTDLRALIDEWLTDPKRPIAVDLTPLTEEDLERMIANVHSPERLPISLAGALRAHAGGIPYMSIEALIEVWAA